MKKIAKIAILTIFVTVVFTLSAIVINLVYPVAEISEDVVSEDEAPEDDVSEDEVSEDDTSESEVSEDDILGDDDEVFPVDKISEAAKQWQRRNLSRFSDPYYYYYYMDEKHIHFSLEAYTDIDLNVTWSDVNERCGDIVITPNDELGVIMFELRLHCVQPEDDTGLPPRFDDGDYCIPSFSFAFMHGDESSDSFMHSLTVEVMDQSVFLDMHLAGRHIYISREVLLTADDYIQYFMEVGNEDIAMATETVPVVAV